MADAPKLTNSVRSILSINLEDYFQVAAMRQVIPQRYWSRFALRVEKSTLATLDLLDRTNQKATFFVLGWIAERCPDLIAEVARRGHDVASKGFLHRNYAQLSPEDFRVDFQRSRSAIEAATGQKVLGYRIASGALPTDDLTPYEILAKEGVKYDSSVRPFGLAYIGRPEWRKVREIKGDDWSLTEVPLSSDDILGVPIPITGGNYLRQAPRALYERRLASYLQSSTEPWHLYFHTWEFDPDQPRVSAARRLSQIRHYRNLEKMKERVEAFLTTYRFQSISEYLGLAPEAAVASLPVTAAIPVQVQAAGGTKATIVVPCYNEEETLPYLAGNLASFAKETAGRFDFSYIFVDDGSADGTWAKLQELFGDRADCQLIKHPENRGIAAATMTGIRAARDEIVCGIDCDCSFDPHELAKMIPLLTPDVDLVQASPYHPKGGVMNVPAWRLALSRNLSRIYNRILNHRFASYTACFRVYRRSKIAPLQPSNGGFMGIMEMFILLDQSGSKIVEYPAVLETRLLGVSKMKTLSVIRQHLGLIRELLFSRADVLRRAGVGNQHGAAGEARRVTREVL